MEEGFVLMNLSKHKRWRARRVIAKQQSKRQKENRLILFVYTQGKSMYRWREFDRSLFAALVKVLCIVDQDHQRCAILVDHSRKFNGV